MTHRFFLTLFFACGTQAIPYQFQSFLPVSTNNTNVSRTNSAPYLVVDPRTDDVYVCSGRQLCHLDQELVVRECTELGSPCGGLVIRDGESYLLALAEKSTVHSLRDVGDSSPLVHDSNPQGFPACPHQHPCYHVASSDPWTVFGNSLLFTTRKETSGTLLMSGSVVKRNRDRQVALTSQNPNFEMDGIRNQTVIKDARLGGVYVSPSFQDKMDFIFTYSFTHDKFVYHVVNQRHRDVSTNFQAYVVRTCPGKGLRQSYMEIPLEPPISSQYFATFRKYRFAQHGFLSVPETSSRSSPILYVVFNRVGSKSYSRPFAGSLVVGYYLNKINEQLGNMAIQCIRDGRGSLAPWMSRSTNNTFCTRQYFQYSSTRRRSEHLSCGGGGTNEGITSLTALQPQVSWSWHVKDTFVTSITLANYPLQVRNEKVALLGTDNGELLKVMLRTERRSGTYSLENDILGRFDLGGDLTSVINIVPDAYSTNVYAVSSSKVVKFPVESCAVYGDCGDCIATVDPLACGWLGNRCTRKSSLTGSKWQDTNCPPILREITPVSGPVDGGTLVTLHGENFGRSPLCVKTSGSTSKAEVLIGQEPCPMVQWEPNRIVCRTNGGSIANKALDVEVSVMDTSKQTIAADIAGRAFLRSGGFTYKVLPGLSLEDAHLYPSSGPVSGGTSLSISGSNMDIGSLVIIRIGKGNCNVTGRTEKEIFCQTPPHQLDYSEHFAMSYPKLATEVVTISIDGTFITVVEKFTYMPDPVVDNIYPRVAFASGGIPIRIEGRHLNVVQEPKLIVQHVGGTYTQTSKCTPLTTTDGQGTGIQCPAPPVPISNELGLSDPSQLVNVWLEMDGVMATRYLPALRPKMATLTYFPDPVLTRFDGVRTFYSNETLLYLEGKDLSSIVHMEDIVITIGSTPCRVTDIQPELVVCEPNITTELASLITMGENVKVNVGNLEIDLGILRIRSPGKECICPCACD